MSLCLVIGIFGACRVYESMRLIGYGEYKKAIATDGKTVRIFDYTIKLPKEIGFIKD